MDHYDDFSPAVKIPMTLLMVLVSPLFFVVSFVWNFLKYGFLLLFSAGIIYALLLLLIL